MRKVAGWAMTTIILGNITLLAGCAPFTGAASSGVISGGSTTGTTGSGGQIPASSSGQGGSPPSSKGSASSDLSPLTMSGMAVRVPKDWTQTSIGGTGDWGGYKLVNPSDPNQQITVVSSSCVGCYTDTDGSVNPKLVIPQTNATDILLSNQGRTVQYQVPATKTGYDGIGVLTVSNDGNGYGYVEVFLPNAGSALAKQIIDSFQFSK